MKKTFVETLLAMKMSLRLSLLALTLSFLPLLPAAQAQQTLAFGQEISFQSAHGRFLVAEPDGGLNADREEIGDWERFRLVNPMDETSTQSIHFGESVALRSAHDTFVVAELDGAANADRPAVSDWETWTLKDPFDATNTALVRARDAVSLLSFHGRYLVAEPDSRANADRPQIDSWETWRIGREWTDFYYDKALACRPGECCPCPYRGRFDGANCFVARPPVRAIPLLADGEFSYQSPVPGRCPLGSAVGPNCRVGSNPAAPPPFLFDSGFYLSSLCSPAGELKVQVERVAHCTLPAICGNKLTREEFRPWEESGVPNGIQRNTHLGVVFGPAGPARRVALLLAGQQFGTGSGTRITGQRNDFKKGWSPRQPTRDFLLADPSLAQRLLEDEILDPQDSFLAVAFDARFNHKFNKNNKKRIEDAYFRWLRSKFDPQQVELVYLAGYSRGGCLAMRLARRFQEEMPGVPIVGQSFDGVCNRNQGELGIVFPGRVKNPLVSDNSAFAWPTDLRQEFQNQESSLALSQWVGGRPFLLGDLVVRAFSQQNADQPELDLCWYQQRWIDRTHTELGGLGSVQPALDHLNASLRRFAQGPACPPVGRCVKDPTVLSPFECNDLFAADCGTQTECRLETNCRNVSGSLTCRDLGSRAECERYSRSCRWRNGRCRHPLNRPGLECNDLSSGDCGNHSECSLRQECRRESGSLTCGDLFTQDLCERYTRWCDWR